jgi:hypothetical protein
MAGSLRSLGEMFIVGEDIAAEENETDGLLIEIHRRKAVDGMSILQGKRRGKSLFEVQRSNCAIGQPMMQV